MPKKSDRNKVDGPTRNMNRNQDGRPGGKEVKPIPRSNEAAIIVPLPNAKKFKDLNRSPKPRHKKMLRRDF